MTTLNQTMCTSEHQCVTRPGYGYYSKEVRLCRVGEWSAGLSRDGCNHCPPGFSTAGLGSTSAADCDVAPGYTSDGRGGAVACKRGFYKVTLGPDPCLQCPNSTYTADTGSDVLSDCNMCLPGRGAPRIDPGAPACDMCGLNTWSAGLGMMGCAACAPGQVSKVVSTAANGRRGQEDPGFEGVWAPARRPGGGIEEGPRGASARGSRGRPDSHRLTAAAAPPPCARRSRRAPRARRTASCSSFQTAAPRRRTLISWRWPRPRSRPSRRRRRRARARPSARAARAQRTGASTLCTGRPGSPAASACCACWASRRRAPGPTLTPRPKCCSRCAVDARV